MGLALIEGLGGFAETTGETIVNESGLQDLLQGYEVVSFGSSGSGQFKRTCRASSTDNFPFGGASVAVTSTCSST